MLLSARLCYCLQDYVTVCKTMLLSARICYCLQDYVTVCKTMLLSLSSVQTVIEQNGLAPGGLNFDCKVRRESIALQDMFISHIGETSISEGCSLASRTRFFSCRCYGYVCKRIEQCRQGLDGRCPHQGCEGPYLIGHLCTLSLLFFVHRNAIAVMIVE